MRPRSAWWLSVPADEPARAPRRATTFPGPAASAWICSSCCTGSPWLAWAYPASRSRCCDRSPYRGRALRAAEAAHQLVLSDLLPGSVEGHQGCRRLQVILRTFVPGAAPGQVPRWESWTSRRADCRRAWPCRRTHVSLIPTSHAIVASQRPLGSVPTCTCWADTRPSTDETVRTQLNQAPHTRSSSGRELPHLHDECRAKPARGYSWWETWETRDTQPSRDGRRAQ